MSTQSKRLYEFGPFLLDTSERLLLVNEEAVKLTPKAFDTLLALIESNGHLVEKDDLMKAVWPDTFVDENTLTSNISTLRKALGQSNGDQYIETVPKLGYRFIANVREVHVDSGGLLIQRRTRSRVILREEQTVITPARHSFLRSSLASKSRRALLAVSALVIGLIVTAFVWESNRQSRIAAGSLRNQAYESYLQGRAMWNKRTGDGLFKSISYFEQAIKTDPSFALGYAGLADAYAFDYEHWPKVEAMANKALELDDALAEPHATLGFIRMFWQWNWAEAEREFKRALELNPGYATAHQWYAIWLAAESRPQWAKAEMRQALELDPSSLPIRSDMAQMFYFSHQYDEAIAVCKETLAIDPDFINAHNYLYQAYTQRGLYAEAIEEFFKLQQLVGDSHYNDPANKETLRKAYAVEGVTGFWKANLELLLKERGHSYTNAEYCALLGEKDQALDWLQNAFESRDFDFVFVNVNPAFGDLHNPRFRSLVTRAGLGLPDSHR